MRHYQGMSEVEMEEDSVGEIVSRLRRQMGKKRYRYRFKMAI